MFKLAKSMFRQSPWPQLRFPTAGFDIIRDNVVLEEEQLDEFRRGVYYPVNIGDVFATKYQVVGKLGFGITSTVWLARDLQYVICIAAYRDANNTTGIVPMRH
jgi:serine/threonine-protein kinase SRPK3